MKVLLVAYACAPNTGSEPGVGWKLTTELASRQAVTTLTRSNNREAIEEELRCRPRSPAPSFWYYDLPRWALFLKRKGILGVKLYYALWQLGAYFHYRRETVRQRFDIVHHLTFNSFEMIGPWWRLKSLHFVAGPLGGGQTTPFRLLGSFGKGAILEGARTARIRLNAWNPWVALALSHASHVLFSNRDTWHLCRRWLKVEGNVLVEAGVYPDDFFPAPKPEGRPFTLVFLGSLIPRKGVACLLESLRLCREEGVGFRCELIGAGPLENSLKQTVRRYGLQDHVHFLGRKPHPEVVAHLQEADALVFPSLRDTSGNVVLEAMACALPVIAIAHQGVLDMVDEHCGVLVEAGSSHDIVKGLAAAITRLSCDPELRRALGVRGRKRVEKEFSWSAKAEKIDEVYRRLPGRVEPVMPRRERC